MATPLIIELVAYSNNLRFVWSGGCIRVFNQRHSVEHDFIDAEIETIDDFSNAIQNWLALPEDVSNIR